jgi:hypothetical protein
VATFLDALAELIRDPSARAEYREHPAHWLGSHGAGDLCGEDVLAGLETLREWLPEPAGELRLRGAPSPTPGPGEDERAAGIRVLGHSLDILEATVRGPVGA